MSYFWYNASGHLLPSGSQGPQKGNGSNGAPWACWTSSCSLDDGAAKPDRLYRQVILPKRPQYAHSQPLLHHSAAGPACLVPYSAGKQLHFGGEALKAGQSLQQTAFQPRAARAPGHPAVSRAAPTAAPAACPGVGPPGTQWCSGRPPPHPAESPGGLGETGHILLKLRRLHHGNQWPKLGEWCWQAATSQCPPQPTVGLGSLSRMQTDCSSAHLAHKM